MCEDKCVARSVGNHKQGLRNILWSDERRCSRQAQGFCRDVHSWGTWTGMGSLFRCTWKVLPEILSRWLAFVTLRGTWLASTKGMRPYLCHFLATMYQYCTFQTLKCTVPANKATWFSAHLPCCRSCVQLKFARECDEAISWGRLVVGTWSDCQWN